MEKGVDLICRQKTKKEEHVSLIGEPGQNYLGHISTMSGTASKIESGIANIVYNTFCAVGCAGTVTNTGEIGGVIRLI